MEGDIGAGAHLAEDGKTIVIYANLNDYNSLDMYTALDNLMKEVYHDNMINAYTYNKTEEQVRNDKNIANKEEGSTQTIGDYKNKDNGTGINWDEKLIDDGKLAENIEEYEINEKLGLLEFDDGSREIRVREKKQLKI